MMHNPTLIRETQQRLYALYDKGKIKPVIHQADNMDQLQQSLELLANRRIHGKLVWSIQFPVETEPFPAKTP